MAMTLPLYEGGPWLALLFGVLFGVVLEGAGFGSPRKLTAQFTLRDFSVFKVMFTAVVVAAVGLYVVEAIGASKPGGVYIPTLYLWSIALGGALIGAGFAIGGYCPGTSAVGCASGRVDALVFILGMVIGVGVFAVLFEPLQGLYRAAEGPKRQTLDALLGVPTPLLLAALVLIAAVGVWLGGRVERAFGGPLSVAEVAGRDVPQAP